MYWDEVTHLAEQKLCDLLSLRITVYRQATRDSSVLLGEEWTHKAAIDKIMIGTKPSQLQDIKLDHQWQTRNCSFEILSFS